MKFNPHKYQQHCTEHVVNNLASGLILTMGLGKTAVVLTALVELIYNRFTVDKVLIVAPLKVAESVWPDEIAKWDHTKGLSYSLVLGNPAKRRAALQADVNLYIINRENVAWLYNEIGDEYRFDMIVLDELSSFKNSSSKRFKVMKKLRKQVKRVVGLTGTPAPNTLIDLWSQIGLLDGGKRLGRFKTHYEAKYFYPIIVNNHVVYKWGLKPGAEELIYEAISDICISVDYKDNLELPGRTNITFPVEWPEAEHKRYKRFKQDMFLRLAEGEITAVNAAVLANKLLQYTGGAVYDEDRKVIPVNKEKIRACIELVEQAQGEPVIIFYLYKHELTRLMKELQEYSPRTMDTPADIKDWNAGRVKVMLTHPASSGHGLNLQEGGHIIIWYGLPWSLELYQQATARIDRQGQKFPVQVYHLIVKRTYDKRVMAVLLGKKQQQDSLIEALKAEVK